MKRSLLIAIPLLLCVVVAAWWARPRSKPAGDGYVSEPTTTLWSSMAQVKESVATLHYGDRVQILERRGERVRVRTNPGAVGWLDAHALMNPSLWQLSTQLLAQAQNIPVQARGRTKVSTNVRIEAGRTGVRLYQFGRGAQVEVLARAVADWANYSDESGAGGRDAGPEEQKKEDWYLVRGQATSGFEASGDTGAKPRDVASPADPSDQSVPIAGWIVARFVELDLPEPVRAYAVASGTRVMAWFDLNRVSELSGGKPPLLAAIMHGPEGQPCDFSMIRVYTWNPRGVHYETSFVEHKLCGKLPIRVGKGAAGEPQFHFTNTGSKGTEERIYHLKQNVVRLVREGDEKTKAARSTSPAR